MFAIANMGNDPDSTGLVNLSGPSDTSVRRSVKGQTPTSQAGPPRLANLPGWPRAPTLGPRVGRCNARGMGRRCV